ncbi:glycosyltransferase family 2 protein [Roseobacter sp. HKCCA0434]|uniref:glycosyltransferase family 2 protein n=1 Tax=Roseobacter sp. HKCCA0434 TaxID=3079297 RepID=UPI002905EB55|nr:glycosyltransferase [Roseobacter sp. HKCCA0434]
MTQIEHQAAPVPGDGTTPVVSMCCVTYNHADTIAQCLDSMLMQQVDVPVEIVVHDDASTDGTAEIVADYAARHPGLIRAILREENQFSKGRRPAALAFAEARGDYFALCEGDDFWTDPTKIARQLAALEGEPDIDMCAHAVMIWQYRNGEKVAERVSRDVAGIHDAGAVLERRQMLLATGSLFVRRTAAERFMDYVNERPWLKVGDLYLKYFGAQRGGVKILADPMGVYRLSFSGSWSERNYISSNHLFEQVSAKIRSYQELSNSIAKFYSEDIKRTIIRSARAIATDAKIPISQRLRFLRSNARLIPPAALPKLVFLVIFRRS